ncbi:MAG: PAS domain-containing protein, partial [Hymenobacter sp.]
DFANPEMALIWGRPLEQVLGKPMFEALPEVAGQGFEQIFADVLTHGTPYSLQEAPVTIDRAQTGRPTLGYFNISYQPQYDGQGRITGIAMLALEVTEQVLARQHTQALNEKLAALNKELQASNEEYLAANAALAVSQRQLRALTQELEARVLARTQQAQVAQAEAETQRQRLATLLAQVPALIASLTGPRHIVALTNAGFQQLYSNRELVGKPCAEALPELVSQSFIALLDQVYQTGETHYGHETLAYIDRTGTGPLEGRYFNFIYQATRDAGGQVTGVLVFATDVTEGVRARQQAETMQAAMLAVAQRQAQQRQDLYQIFEQTPAAIVLLREPDHRIDYFNPAFQALFPPEEWAGALRGHPLTEVYPRLKVAGLVTLLDQVFRTGEGLIVNEMPLADLQPGSPRFVTFSYQAYREQERIAGVSAFVYDVTEQVLARREREARQAELQRIFEQAPVAITILRGPELVIELANAAISHLWGRPAAGTLGRPLFAALPETVGQGFEAVMHQPGRCWPASRCWPSTTSWPAPTSSCATPIPTSIPSCTRPATTSRPPSPTSRGCSLPCAGSCPRRCWPMRWWPSCSVSWMGPWTAFSKPLATSPKYRSSSRPRRPWPSTWPRWSKMCASTWPRCCWPPRPACAWMWPPAAGCSAPPKRCARWCTTCSATPSSTARPTGCRRWRCAASPRPAGWCSRCKTMAWA